MVVVAMERTFSSGLFDRAAEAMGMDGVNGGGLVRRTDSLAEGGRGRRPDRCERLESNGKKARLFCLVSALWVERATVLSFYVF